MAHQHRTGLRTRAASLTFSPSYFRFNRYGPLAVLFRTSMALTEFSNALSKTRLPMVPSTKPSTRPDLECITRTDADCVTRE
jgi:hypothetical protein